MKVIQTSLKDCFVIEPKVIEDERGYFFESFNSKKISEQIDINTHFVQSNQSRSNYGVLRGLHYQLNPYPQAKLVRVLHGSVLDVVVDLREGSPTYAQIYSVLLTAENKKQLYIPRGFAHGFVVHSEWAEIFYNCDNYYAPEYEKGISFNDPMLNIDWGLDEKELTLSERDKNLLSFKEAQKNFVY